MKQIIKQIIKRIYFNIIHIFASLIFIIFGKKKKFNEITQNSKKLNYDKNEVNNGQNFLFDKLKTNQIENHFETPGNNIYKIFASIKNEFEPNTIIEIGTAFGSTTLYLRNLFKNSRIITIEPDETFISSHAYMTFSEIEKVKRMLKKENIECYKGTSADLLNENFFIDGLNNDLLIFIDGCHTYPGLSYDIFFLLNVLSKKTKGKIVFVFDDYYPIDFMKTYKKLDFMFYSQISDFGEDHVSRSCKYIFDKNKYDENLFFKNKQSEKNIFSASKNYFSCVSKIQQK